MEEKGIKDLSLPLQTISSKNEVNIPQNKERKRSIENISVQFEREWGQRNG